MKLLLEKAALVQNRLLNSEEHSGEAAIPVVAEHAAAVIGGLIATLKEVEHKTRAAEKQRCARIAEGVEKPAERHWVPGSLYDKIRREIAAEILRPEQGEQTAEKLVPGNGLSKFTVVAVEQGDGHIAFIHVWATDGINAFASAAVCRPDTDLVVAMPEWLNDEKDVFCPGEGAVDAMSVREQEDVYGDPAFCVTGEHYRLAMQKMADLGKLTLGRESISEAAARLWDETSDRANEVAMRAEHPGSFQDSANAEIHSLLVRNNLAIK